MGITLLSNFNNILEFDCSNFKVFYNMNNSKMISIKNEYFKYKDMFFEKNNFFETELTISNFSKVIIAVNITSSCNLRCKYCFNDKKSAIKVDIDKIKNFINFIVNTKSSAEKYFVDLAGSGEPLLYINDIIKIAKYCQKVSDKIGKEVTPMLSTNGTLLSAKYTSLLQDNGVLFGISLDGYKELHDRYRVDIKGNPTYDIIKKNILKIKFNDYVGGSMTIVDSNTDIFKTYIEMGKLFKTISIRPGRMSYKDFDFEFISKGYNDFIGYLINQTLMKQYDLLYKIINGDDLLGKTILKIISNSKLSRRCEAGIARFSLGIDGKIYPCTPASYHKELEMTEEQIEKGENNVYFNYYPKKCQNCIAKNVCGSDCYVQLFENSLNDSLCIFKKNIFMLAIYFCGKIETTDFDTYCEVVNMANEIINRTHCDKELNELFSKCSHKYSFTELKRIKDNNKSKYSKILKKYT